MNPTSATSNGKAASPPGQPVGEATQLAEEISHIRGNLGRLLNDLGRRRHDTFDIRVQLRRHRTPILIGMISITALLGGAITWNAYRRSQRPRISQRLLRRWLR